MSGAGRNNNPERAGMSAGAAGESARATDIVCGIDFDNTIVIYDELMTSLARERGWIDGTEVQTKRIFRDRIRQMPDGEIEWRKCQAMLYGRRIGEAKLAEGAAAFVGECRRRGIEVHIVSHKTEFSRYDDTGTNLRTAAMNWMIDNRFFEPDGLGLTTKCVHFEATRAQKIGRIRQLRCTHFIDDLEETFLEATFPPAVARILYEPGRQSPAPHGVALVRTWQEVRDYFFGGK